MPNLDYSIYMVHVAFWTAFGLTRTVLRIRDSRHQGDTAAPASAEESSAPFSRMLIGFHALAFAVMYFGVGNAVIPRRVPAWFRGQRLVGAMLITAGAALAVAALASFRSWRFRAAVDKGHELATGGPFGLIRHPIYMALNLLALGTAIWVPTATVWTAFVLMTIGSDLRARAEEALMEKVFDSAYRTYRTQTRRFIPGVY